MNYVDVMYNDRLLQLFASQMSSNILASLTDRCTHTALYNNLYYSQLMCYGTALAWK